MPYPTEVEIEREHLRYLRDTLMSDGDLLALHTLTTFPRTPSVRMEDDHEQHQ